MILINTYMVVELINQWTNQVDREEVEEDNITITNMDKHRTILNMHSTGKYEKASLYNNCNNDNRVHRHSKIKFNFIDNDSSPHAVSSFVRTTIQSRHLRQQRCLIDFLNCHTLLIKLFEKEEEKQRIQMDVDEQMTTSISQHSSHRYTISFEREYFNVRE